MNCYQSFHKNTYRLHFATEETFARYAYHQQQNINSCPNVSTHIFPHTHLTHTLQYTPWHTLTPLYNAQLPFPKDEHKTKPTTIPPILALRYTRLICVLISDSLNADIYTRNRPDIDAQISLYTRSWNLTPITPHSYNATDCHKTPESKHTHIHKPHIVITTK